MTQLDQPTLLLVLKKVLSEPNDFPNGHELLDLHIVNITKKTPRDFMKSLDELIELLQSIPVGLREKMNYHVKIGELKFLKAPTESAFEAAIDLVPEGEREKRKKDLLGVLLLCKDNYSSESIRALLSFFFEQQSWDSVFHVVGCLLMPLTLSLLTDKYKEISASEVRQKSFLAYISNLFQSSKYLDSKELELEYPLWEFLINADITLALKFAEMKTQMLLEYFLANTATPKRKGLIVMWFTIAKVIYSKANKHPQFLDVVKLFLRDLKKRPALVKEVNAHKEILSDTPSLKVPNVHKINRTMSCWLCNSRHAMANCFFEGRFGEH